MRTTQHRANGIIIKIPLFRPNTVPCTRIHQSSNVVTKLKMFFLFVLQIDLCCVSGGRGPSCYPSY